MRVSLKTFHVSSSSDRLFFDLFRVLHLQSLQSFTVIMLLFHLFTGSLGAYDENSDDDNEIYAKVPQSRCPPKCRCVWRGGKEVVDCNSSAFKTLPAGIRSDVQVLIFNNNKISLLEPRIFQELGLTHLQKIYLSK